MRRSRIIGGARQVELELDRSTHVYVINEDARGDVHLLFPLPSLDTTNPLDAGAQRLPGTVGGRGFGWQITSAGGEEHVLVLRSRDPLAGLETALADLPGASEDRRVAAAGPFEDRLRQTLRGIAGLAPSSPDARAGSFLRALVESHGLESRDGVDAELLRFVSVP